MEESNWIVGSRRAQEAWFEQRQLTEETFYRGFGAGKIAFTTAGPDALILRQRDVFCRKDWAAFPSRYLGKVLASGRSVSF